MVSSSMFPHHQFLCVILMIESQSLTLFPFKRILLLESCYFDLASGKFRTELNIRLLPGTKAGYNGC